MENESRDITRITIRMPEVRRARLHDLAWRRRKSMNELVNDIIQAELDREEG